MNEEAKKKLLKAVPHALYVLTCLSKGRTAASTVSWVTQASFQPPLLALGLKADSRTFELVREKGDFVLNFLGADQKEQAQKFFKHVEPEGSRLAGEDFRPAPLTGHPFFPSMAGYIECRVQGTIEKGDHALVAAEVLEAALGPSQGILLLSATGWSYGG